MNEVEVGIQTILEDPEVWRVVEGDVRRYLVKKFPYGLFYTIENETVIVWAVAHLQRHPNYWKERRK